MFRRLSTMFCVFLFAALAFASEVDKKTVITLTQPIIVAGVPVVTLQPGVYVMRLLNSSSNRNIVQIYNEREDKLFTTVLAISNYHLTTKDKTALSFYETPAGNPPALHAWFYPGDNFGQEFVYPKGLAARIARETGAPVLTTPAQTAAELQTAPVTATNKTGEEKPVELDVYTAQEIAPTAAEPVQVAAATPAPAAPAPAAPAPAPLPATGSPFFEIGLAGLSALGAGLALRRRAF